MGMRVEENRFSCSNVLGNCSHYDSPPLATYDHLVSNTQTTNELVEKELPLVNVAGLRVPGLFTHLCEGMQSKLTHKSY